MATWKAKRSGPQTNQPLIFYFFGGETQSRGDGPGVPESARAHTHEVGGLEKWLSSALALEEPERTGRNIPRGSHL